MRVKFIKSATVIGFGYMNGNEAILSNKLAKEFIQKGFAVPLDLPEEPEPEKEKVKPVRKRRKKIQNDGS